MDDHEIDLFRSTVRHIVETVPADDLRDRLLAEGWFELLAEEPDVAVGVLFEEHGRALANAPLLDDLVLGALGGDAADERRRVVLHPAAPGGPTSSVTPDGTAHLVGVALVAPRPGELLVVPVRTPEGLGLLTTDAPIDARPLGGIDADAGRLAIDVEVPADRAEVAVLDEATWDRAVALARRALAHELVGLVDHMLELAVAHVVDRRQFGQPLGAFQAVQQRLADVSIAVSAAGAAIRAAWVEDDQLVSTMARSLATSAHETAARECQQVMGGIGFTWEHPLHRYIRRGFALDVLFGSARHLEREIGERLIVEARVPRLPFDIGGAGPHHHEETVR